MEGNGCQFGESCSFAHGHGEVELRTFPTLSYPPFNSLVLSSNKSFSQVRNVQMNLAALNPNYKGSLCKYFMTTGECEFGSICQYAHGNMVCFTASLHRVNHVLPGVEEEPVHGRDARPRDGWNGWWWESEL